MLEIKSCLRLHLVFSLTDHLKNYLYIVKTVTPTDAFIQLKDDAHAEVNIQGRDYPNATQKLGILLHGLDAQINRGNVNRSGEGKHHSNMLLVQS